MITKILELMEIKNVSASKLTKDLGLANNAITVWKKGTASPSTEAIIKIAKYFNVTTDYLLGVEKSPATREDPTEILIKEITKKLQSLPENYLNFANKFLEELVTLSPKNKK